MAIELLSSYITGLRCCCNAGGGPFTAAQSLSCGILETADLRRSMALVGALATQTLYPGKTCVN